LPLQAKILRAIEERRFERVGGTAPLQVDVRLVAATNKDLRAAVSARQFREDLYFRLSVFPITIPPLRDRREDIPLLARYFIDRFCKDLKKPVTALSAEAEEVLSRYPWPGNVRELQNCIERAVILGDTPEIQPRHLSLGTDAEVGLGNSIDPWELLDLSGTLEEASARIYGQFERHKLSQAMREAEGVTQVAAERLKISHQSLLDKLKRIRSG
jgi:transcriptional regulator with GAF, ATPase, and Fis domain